MNLLSKFVLLLVLISPLQNTLAQGTVPASDGWPVTQRCVGEFTYPSLTQDKWNFEGVIFSDNGLGIRAIRTDFPTSYYVAMDSDSSFAFDGAFSPDGKRFVYPTGVTQYNNMVSSLISVDALQVVSTDPRQEKVTVPWRSLSYSGVTRGISPPRWFDNTYFVADGGILGGSDTSGTIDAVTGEFTAWKGETFLNALYGFSPDMQRAMYYGYDSDTINQLYDVANDQLITEFQTEIHLVTWLPDSQSFIGEFEEVDAAQNTINTLALFNRSGDLQDIMITRNYQGYNQPVLASNGSKFAFFQSGKLYVADLNTKQIVNLCFDFTNYSKTVAWSPDSDSFVVSYDGFPVIVNYETLNMQVLRYEANRIWGWYPVDKLS